jgi:hypothetical protein
MALERTFGHLLVQLTALKEALEALGTTVEEDRSKRGDVVVAANLADAVLTARGFVEESRSAAEEARQAVMRGLDHDRTRRALIRCQEQFHRFVTQFYSDVTSYERLDDLVSVARDRNQQWSTWVDVVRQGIEHCRVPLDEVRDAQFLCWQELVERVSTASVSVHNTTIGQQITAPELAGKEAEIEGMT